MYQIMYLFVNFVSIHWKKECVFLPNCYYWSSPKISKLSSKHNTICNRNNKKLLKNKNIKIMI